MPNNQAAHLNGKDINSLLKLNCSFSGQSATQAGEGSMDLTSREPSQNAAEEMSLSLLEPYIPSSKDYERKGLLTLTKVTLLQEEPSASIIISPQLESQLSTIQTTSFLDYQAGLPPTRQTSQTAAKALGEELFFTKCFSSPLSILMGPEEQTKVVARAEQLTQWRKEGRSIWFTRLWDFVYFLDLLLFYGASRLERVYPSFANVILNVAIAK